MVDESPRLGNCFHYLHKISSPSGNLATQGYPAERRQAPMCFLCKEVVGLIPFKFDDLQFEFQISQVPFQVVFTCQVLSS